MHLEFSPVTPERLPDLARFSETHGKFRYCSCMRWRMTSSEFHYSTAEERAKALEALVIRGVPVGILALYEEAPVAWCSVAPRETYAALARYRALQLAEGTGIWSVVCFFLDHHWRKQGLTLQLLAAATNYAHEQGATIVEGYPVEPDSRSYTYMGSPATFSKAGFREVAGETQRRRIMRHFA